MSKPLVIELFAGRFGWSRGFVAEGFQSIGFDIVHEDYHGPVPEGCELVLQDVLTLHGSQFKDATVIVASPPCQAYSYRAMPWKRAKALPPPSNELFDACFRIAREAGCPLVVENVKGAQPWVGRAAWHYGSFYLWGDVPALMPATKKSKTVGHANIRDGHTHTRHLTNQRESDGLKVPGIKLSEVGFNVAAAQRWREGQKAMQCGGGSKYSPSDPSYYRSGTDSRKAASAAIAEIPYDLANWIARCFKPETAVAVRPQPSSQSPVESLTYDSRLD